MASCNTECAILHLPNDVWAGNLPHKRTMFTCPAAALQYLQEHLSAPECTYGYCGLALCWNARMYGMAHVERCLSHPRRG